MLLQADSEDSDPTVWMAMVIGVFAGRIDHYLDFDVL